MPILIWINMGNGIEKMGSTKHNRIQEMIVSACHDLGFYAVQEHAGKGWRADVFVPNKNIAFEVQLSPQSLKSTEKRQGKYIRDEINCCWLFENPVAKLNEERPDLPLFYVEEINNELHVNLGDRRKISLHEFLRIYLSNKIQFKTVARTKRIQRIRFVFYKMECWKCGELNYLYFVDTPFYSACNAKIKPEEALWESNSMEYRPEIIEVARKFLELNSGLSWKLGEIKKRYSNTVGKYYTSFGCHKCDSIFGDFYVMEAKIDVMYEPRKLIYEGEFELKEDIILPIKHWCYPGEHKFCGD